MHNKDAVLSSPHFWSEQMLLNSLLHYVRQEWSFPGQFQVLYYVQMHNLRSHKLPLPQKEMDFPVQGCSQYPIPGNLVVPWPSSNTCGPGLYGLSEIHRHENLTAVQPVLVNFLDVLQKHAPFFRFLCGSKVLFLFPAALQVLLRLPDQTDHGCVPYPQFRFFLPGS